MDVGPVRVAAMGCGLVSEASQSLCLLPRGLAGPLGPAPAPPQPAPESNVNRNLQTIVRSGCGHPAGCGGLRLSGSWRVSVVSVPISIKSNKTAE